MPKLEWYASHLSSQVNSPLESLPHGFELSLLKRRLRKRHQPSKLSQVNPVAIEDHQSTPNVPTDQVTQDTSDLVHVNPTNSLLDDCVAYQATSPASVEMAIEKVVHDPPSFAEILSRKSFQKLVVKWTCTTCSRECIPVREESRCLCGHRLKEHPTTSDDIRVKDKKKFKPFACTSTRCPCQAFFYIVAEGAWVLRCRCKHKHIDHDPGQAPFICKKPKCSCDGFTSPWVCNCAHPWANHVQSQEMKTFHPMQMDLGDELGKVHRTDLVHEPMQL